MIQFLFLKGYSINIIINVNRRPSDGGKGGAGVVEGAGRKKIFLYGNYDTYYGYRNPGAQDDPRIQVCLSPSVSKVD
jgi:hypothetical protein